MPAVNDNADSLVLYGTGAHFLGGTQPDEAANLGGSRSSTEIRSLEARWTNPIGGIRVTSIKGANDTGDGLLTAKSASTIAWTAPGGTEGTAVTLTDGSTVLVEDTTASKAVIVTRNRSSDLFGQMTGALKTIFNNAIGMKNVTDAQATAGLSTYRGFIFRNDRSATNVTNFNVWVKPLDGAAQTTDTTQLGATGSGTIETTGSFTGWPRIGGAHVKDSGGTTREVVYYNKRTDTVLTVGNATYRGLLGTSAGAGASDDTVEPVPLIRISGETTSSDTIQTIADEETAPSSPAPSWDTGTTSATGISVGTVTPGSTHGLWIHRQIPANANAWYDMECAIAWQFDIGATTYSNEARGKYRVANSSVAQFELKVGSDADPDLTSVHDHTLFSPDDTSATEDFTYALAPPGAGTRQYRWVVIERDKYGLASLNQFHRVVEIDSAGALVQSDPSVPSDVQVAETDGGKLRVLASYQTAHDDPPADTFRIYARGDGTNPDGTETPTAVTMVKSGLLGGSTRRLNKEIGPFAKGGDVRISVSAYRSGDAAESALTTAVSTTISTKTPPKPLDRRIVLSDDTQRQDPDTRSETHVWDAGTSTQSVISVGRHSFEVGGTEIIRINYDAANPDNNGFYTKLAFRQDSALSFSGAASNTPVDVVSSTEIYISVGGVRTMKIDLTANTISCAALRQATAGVVDYGSATPIVEVDEWWTVFQVFDRVVQDEITPVHLGSDGILRFRNNLPWRQDTAGVYE